MRPTPLWQGIDLRFNTSCTAMAKNASGGITCTLADGTTVDVDVAMFATGRKPRTSDLRCDKAGVALDEDGAVVVDEAFLTTSASVYAIGDVINRMQVRAGAMHAEIENRSVWGASL